LGKNGHHRILSNYSLDSVADRLGNLYMKLLSTAFYKDVPG
jgi:hypothetical protein